VEPLDTIYALGNVDNVGMLLEVIVSKKSAEFVCRSSRIDHARGVSSKPSTPTAFNRVVVCHSVVEADLFLAARPTWQVSLWLAVHVLVDEVARSGVDQGFDVHPKQALRAMAFSAIGQSNLA